MRQIYRITHINNLPFILEHGLFCSNSKIKDPAFTQIGFPTLIAHRNDRVVPIEPGGTLADYVPFYFSVKSPMLYVIAQANDPEIIKTPQEEIVYLVSTTDKLQEQGCNYIFTDRHAQLEYAQFYNNPQQLELLNWELIHHTQWGRAYGAERKEIKQAECLVHRQLPVNAFIGIGCMNQAAEQNIQSILLKNDLKIPLKIKSEWYF